MQCPRCRQGNPSQARFCMKCGAGLALACTDCGTNAPMGAAFCFGCGRAVVATPAAGSARDPEAYTPKYLAEKILTSRSALEGERKQVTVLFADIAGFTSLSERLDPEDVHGLMTRALELMLAEVHRYEGTVNQFLGDGVMALFGAPIAHEDHAQRAVHAAVAIRAALDGYRTELQRRRGIDFQVRQGLNTGLVVVGSIGNDLRMDYTAAGDTTNVAARLQQMAQPGSILIAEPTHRLTAGYFHIRPLGTLHVRGKTEPVTAWEVLTAREARGRFEVEAEQGLTALVGREREVAALWDCFEKARAGQGQMVFIVGEPGIGKSRLVYELRRRVGDQAGWLEGRCVSFGRSIPFHPVIDLLRRRLGIEGGDDEQTARPPPPPLPPRRSPRAMPSRCTTRPRQLPNGRARAFRSETRMTIHRRRAELYVLVSDFDRARAESEDVLRLARQSGDRHAEGEALAAMGQASLLGHHFDQCLDDSRQAAEIAEAIDAPSILAGGLLNEAFVYEVTGRSRGCPDEVRPCPRPQPSDRGCRQPGDRAGLRRGTRKLGRSLCAGGQAVRRGDPARPYPQHPRDARGHVHGGGQPHGAGRV